MNIFRVLIWQITRNTNSSQSILKNLCKYIPSEKLNQIYYLSDFNWKSFSPVTTIEEALALIPLFSALIRVSSGRTRGSPGGIPNSGIPFKTKNFSYSIFNLRALHLFWYENPHVIRMWPTSTQDLQTNFDSIIIRLFKL